MLQGLFEEEGGDGESCYQITSSTGSKTTIEKPLAPRNETNLCGLQNQGATCYLNALIQTLLYHRIS
jgi:ubiquitin carboxyl-terminal hydrolase 40